MKSPCTHKQWLEAWELRAWVAGARLPPNCPASFSLLSRQVSATLFTEWQLGINHGHFLYKHYFGQPVHALKNACISQVFFLNCKHEVILRAYFLFESWICTSGLAKVFWIMNKQLDDPVYIGHAHRAQVWYVSYVIFLQIFQLDPIYFLSLSWGETREYVPWCISVWFLLSLNGVYIWKLSAADKLCENSPFPYVNLPLFFSLLMVSCFPPPPNLQRVE